MRIVLLMFTTTLAFLPAARAESFMCGGVGAFASIHSAVVNFGAGGADQQVLLETNSMRVQAYRDRANHDGTHYLAIEVLSWTDAGEIAIRGAKGSLKDMVQYMESARSIITCVPLNVN